MLRGTVAKNLASSAQGIDCSSILSVAGCLETVVKDVNATVRYGLRVNRANGEAFRVGLLRTCGSIEKVSRAASLKEVGCSLIEASSASELTGEPCTAAAVDFNSPLSSTSILVSSSSAIVVALLTNFLLDCVLSCLSRLHLVFKTSWDGFIFDIAIAEKGRGVLRCRNLVRPRSGKGTISSKELLMTTLFNDLTILEC